MSPDASRIGKLILVPAVITLAVTLLRLVGELQGWSPALFNRGDRPFSPSLVGIVWLVPVFGAWFGWKLTRAGSGPESLGRAFGLTLASMAVLPLFSFLAPKAGIQPEHLWRPNVPLTESFTILSVFVAFAIVGMTIGILAWPALGRTLLAYGLAARIPVAVLMLVAMLGSWGTHYDARPSHPPQMSALGWWVGIGLVPQLFFWLWITIVFGALFGTVAAAIARRRRRAAAALLLFGLGASGAPPLPAMQSAEQDPRQEERPLTRSYHGAAVVNGRIYLIGGAGQDNKPFGSVQVYDPATGTWAARASMPTARALFATGAVGEKIYAIGGTTRGRDTLAVVEAYDTATDTWTRRADMPTPRNALSAAVVDGKVYAIGGWGYDRPEGGWESIDRTATGQDFATVEAYDPKTDTWATRADMPTPRSHMTMSALGGKIYAIGGGARIVAGRSGEWLPRLEVSGPRRGDPGTKEDVSRDRGLHTHTVVASRDQAGT